MSLRRKRAYYPVYPYPDDDVEIEEDEDLKKHKKSYFYIPLSRQRYEFVTTELHRWEREIDKIVDFGCNEGKFLLHAKSKLDNSVTLIGVDIDEGSLAIANENIQNSIDNASDRDSMVRMKLYCGDVSEFDSRFNDVDAVVAIELIEHLNYRTLLKFPEIVFGQIQPFIVIITTPNIEYNVMFDMEGRRFRHDDHRFEWTREQFEKWCDAITVKYKNYWVKFTGVGSDLPRSTAYGFCTQIAVFRMKRSAYLEQRNKRRSKQISDWEQFGDVDCTEHQRNLITDYRIGQPYKLITDVTYPMKISENRLSKILREVELYCSERIHFENLEQEDYMDYKGVWFDLNDLINSAAINHYVKTVTELSVFLHDQGWILDLKNQRTFFEDVTKVCNDDSSEEWDNFEESGNYSPDSVQSSSSSGSDGAEENSSSEGYSS